MTVTASFVADGHALTEEEVCVHICVLHHQTMLNNNNNNNKTSAIAADELHIVLVFSHLDWRGPLLCPFVTEELVAFLPSEYTHAT